MHTEVPSKRADSDDACSGGFNFSSFWLKFFVQHSVSAGERKMSSFFLHRTCHEVLCVSLTNLALTMSWPFPVLHQFATYIKIF